LKRMFHEVHVEEGTTDWELVNNDDLLLTSLPYTIFLLHLIIASYNTWRTKDYNFDENRVTRYEVTGENK